MKAFHWLCTTIVIMTLTSCGARTTPPPNMPASVTAIAMAVIATITAQAPTATSIPTDTPTPTSTSTPSPSPTNTPLPTFTWTPTSTATPRPTETPTPTVTPTHTPSPSYTPSPSRMPSTIRRSPTATAGPTTTLAKIEYLNPHYECQKRIWYWDSKPIWGYRSFQVDMFITNLSRDQTIERWWKPTRWIITNGVQERVDTESWMWVGRDRSKYVQPAILPGEAKGWTWLVFPLERDEWIKAIEYDLWGHTYRQEFDIGPYRNNHNYQDCGEYPPDHPRSDLQK